MKRHEWNFDIWCKTATQHIRYKPDRKRVEAELRSHLDDAFEGYMQAGSTPEEAEEKALESMGRATQVAEQLAAVYTPFWGIVLQVSQVLLVVLLVLSLLPIWNYAKAIIQDRADTQDMIERLFVAEADTPGRIVHHKSQPDVFFRSHGNKFTVTDAALYTLYTEYQKRDMTRLTLIVRQSSILPWDEHDKFLQRSSSSLFQLFYIRDDKGNEYPLLHESSFSTTFKQSGVFSATHVCWVNDFPADSQWAELCYDRDGYSYALRIHLTGGDRT